MPKSYVPRGIETPGQFRLPGRRPRRRRTLAFPTDGPGGGTIGGGRRPSGRPGGVLAAPPVRPAPVTPLPSGPAFGKAPTKYTGGRINIPGVTDTSKSLDPKTIEMLRRPVKRPAYTTNKSYNALTMPSRKGSGPFGEDELRAGYRRMGEALGRADQPGVKAALEVSMRRVSGKKPPALNRGQHTALIYASGRKGSVKARREAAAAKIRLKEQGY